MTRRGEVGMMGRGGMIRMPQSSATMRHSYPRRYNCPDERSGEWPPARAMHADGALQKLLLRYVQES